MEQPEDLGALPTGPHEGLRPASMWQWPQLADLLEKGLRTVAFHQASFGVPCAKPTRLLLCTSLDMPTSSTKACLATMTRAKGPLPSAQGFGKMFQRQAKGAFKTTGSEQWPVAMCQWLSAMLLSSCLLPAKDAVGEGGAAAPDDKLQDSFPINEPEGPRVLGGGPPRFCRQLGGGASRITTGGGYARLAGGPTTLGAMPTVPPGIG